MMKAILTAAAIGILLAASPISTQSVQAQQSKAEKSKKSEAKPLTPGQKAARERQKKCGAEWRAAKAAGKTAKNMTWPKYWSACNKRLKGS